VIVGDWNNYNVLFIHKKTSVSRTLSPSFILSMYISLKLFVGESDIKLGGPCNYGCCFLSMQPLQAAGNEDRQLVQVSRNERQPA